MWVNFSILLIFIYNARLQHISYLNYYSLYFIMPQPLAILQCFNQRISFSQLSVVCLCLMNLKFYQITSRFGIKQQLTHSPAVFLPNLTDDYLLSYSYLCLSFPFYQNILRSYFLYAFIFLIRWSLLGVLFLDCGMETVFLRMNQIANELKIAMIKYLLYIIQNPMMVFSTLFFKFIQKYQRFIGILIEKQRQSFQKYYYLHESILLSLFSSDYILVNFSLYQILVHVILSKKHKDILQKMARANGYIIAKQFQKEGDNFQVSMDISPDNSTLVFGYGPMIKLVTINTSVNFWFSDKKIFGKSPIYCKDQKQKLYIPNNQRVVRDVKWNCCDLGKNLIGVVMGQAAFVYDVQDPQNSKVPEGFLKVFQNDDVMRQGDYSSKFIWYPNSKDVFLCTSSKSDEIISRDLRQSGVVSRFNGTEDLKTDQKVQDLKFNPVDSNIFAIISKSSTIQIFDYRKPTKSIIKSESVVQNYKTNLLDWKKDGKRLVSAFGGLVKLWSFNGSQLTQQYSFEHKNAISDFKWLKKKYTDYLLVSEMQENIIYGYKINQGKHDIQILVDPRHSGLKKFMTDKQEQLILGLTNFQDSKKHQHQMIAVFLDYQSSHNIWQRTKFKKPNHLGLDNQLLFSATNYLYKKERPVDSTFTLVYKQVESSAQKIKLQILDLQQKQSIQEKRLQMEKRLAVKQAHKKMREQRTELKRQIKQRFLMENSRIMLNQKQSIKSEEKKTTSVGRNTKVKKSSSIEQRSQKSISKNQRINDKVSISKKSEDSFSESSSQNNLTFIQKDKWILSYCEEVQYLDQNYKIQINDQIPEQKGEVICKHNSKIAQSIGKNRCAQFWKYIYEIAFSENEEKYNLSGLYQDKIKVQVSFKDNKVVASCENKSQMMKKTIKYSLQKMLQNLVDENQLQTAVMACVMIRNKDEKLLSLQFIEPFLVCYKQLLKAMGLTFISTNLSYIAKLNQAVESPLFRFDIPIGCGQCYKKFNESKCTCLQVCIICGQSLISRLVVGCKICGHMAHAVQYEQLINKGIKKCPYDKCQHECFKKV